MNRIKKFENFKIFEDSKLEVDKIDWSNVDTETKKNILDNLGISKEQYSNSDNPSNEEIEDGFTFFLNDGSIQEIINYSPEVTVKIKKILGD